MKILRAEHLGMCFGVKDAIALAMATARRRPLTILGDLVHNETVLANCAPRGIRISRRRPEYHAHRHDHRARRFANAGWRHEAAASTCWKPPARWFTCPPQSATIGAQGFHPVIIGRRDHVEVRGLTGDLDRFDVILDARRRARGLPNRPAFGVIAQTTQPIEKVRQLVQLLARVVSRRRSTFHRYRLPAHETAPECGGGTGAAMRRGGGHRRRAQQQHP